MCKECSSLKFELEMVKSIRVAELSRAAFEEAIERLQTAHPDVILALLPLGQQGSPDDLYYHFKSVTVRRGLASQVVSTTTWGKVSALANIALGLLSKVGNVPFRLADPLSYADIIVGIDIARSKKTRLAGSMNALATAQIYQNTDPVLQYRVQDALIEGETIPDQVLQALFPRSLFAGKRVLVHRDGWFRGNERQVLKAWAQRIGAELFLVEIIKSGNPRFYRWESGLGKQSASPGTLPQEMYQPLKGSAFRLNDQEAFLISSLPPIAKSTPAPLLIRAEPPLKIEDALHSVLTLTLLHYGSLRAPRLPVTTHYSDKIAYLLLQGICPPTTEGMLPYWI